MNKCEEQGFQHAWEDTTSNVVYATYPPQYPQKQETCKNCWLKRIYRREVKERIEYIECTDN